MVELFDEAYRQVRRIGIGTEVTAVNSMVDGYGIGALYINSDSFKLFKCISEIANGNHSLPKASMWEYMGCLKGDAGSGVEVSTEPILNGTRIIFKDAITHETVETVDLHNGTIGKDGDSITATHESVSGGVKVIMKDKNTGETLDQFTLTNGENGDSITATHETTDTGVKVILKDKNTSETLDEFTLSNGANGENGEDGEDGKIINTWKGDFVSGTYLAGDIARDTYNKSIKMCVLGGTYSSIRDNANWETLVESADGTSISFMGYAITDTQTQPAVADFNKTMPTIEKGKYLWSLLRTFEWKPNGQTTTNDVYLCTYNGADGSGGGGGSDISIDPKLSRGKLSAEITVDGTTYSIYSVQDAYNSYRGNMTNAEGLYSFNQGQLIQYDGNLYVCTKDTDQIIWNASLLTSHFERMTTFDNRSSSYITLVGYALTDTPDVPDDDAFDEDFPTVVKGKYLWSCFNVDSYIKNSQYQDLPYNIYSCAYTGDDLSGYAEIDDTATSDDVVWSASKVNGLIGDVESILAELIGGN